MGSEFAYEDMSVQEVERFSYKYLRDEPCGDAACTVSERYPDAGEVQEISGPFLASRRDDHGQSSHGQGRAALCRLDEPVRRRASGPTSTVLTWADYDFRTKLNERDFSRTGLKRVR